MNAIAGFPIVRIFLAKGGLPSPKQQACLLIFLDESPHDLVRGAQLRFNLRGRTVAQANPDDLRRPALQYAALGKVRILGDNREPISPGILPNGSVFGTTQLHAADMMRFRVHIPQRVHQTRRQVLIEQELHAARVSDLRSRSAANARHARMSSSVR